MSRDKVSLSHLVNTFMQLHTEDSILSPTLKRNKVLLVMRRGIRLFSRSVGGALKAVQIKLENNLYVPYPADYLNYIRVSVLTDDNYLVPIKYNEQIPTAYAQLYSPIPNQDGNFDKLLDPNGIELLSSTPAAIPNFQNEFTDEDFFWFLYNNFPYQMYGNETGNNVWGEFKDDVPNNRFIVTLSKIKNQNSVILEYVSDPTMVLETETTEPRVSVFLEELLYAYVYNELVSLMPNVPAVEKQRAMFSFNTAKRRAKLETSSKGLEDLLHALRTGSKQVAKF